MDRVLAAVRGKWAVPVMRCLQEGVSRPERLLAALNAGEGQRLHRSVMFQVLNRLIAAGLVSKEVPSDAAGRPRDENGWLRADYSLTSDGAILLAQVSRIATGVPSSTAWEVLMEGELPRPALDLSQASPARIWNTWLGGRDNFPADRETADKVQEALPEMPLIARAARHFQRLAVQALLDRGVRQFLDIGTGLPAPGSIHELTAGLSVRVVYVDNDPMVVAHARALLTGGPGECACIEEDLRRPSAILEEASRTLDFTQPVAVVLIGVLHFIPDDDDPWRIVGELLDGLAGDAYLMIGHGASDISHVPSAATAPYNERSSAPIRLRSQAEVARFFAGTELLWPGLVPLGQWPATEPPDDGVLPGWTGVSLRAAMSADLGTGSS